MKQFLAALILFVGFQSLAIGQSFKVDEQTGLATYDTVFKTSGVKEYLFAKGKSYVASKYVNSDQVTLHSDIGLGQLFIKGGFDNTSKMAGTSDGNTTMFVTYNCRMFFKDNKYRVVFTNIHFEKLLLRETTLKIIQERSSGYFMHDAITVADRRFQSIISNLKAYMERKSETDF